MQANTLIKPARQNGGRAFNLAMRALKRRLCPLIILALLTGAVSADDGLDWHLRALLSDSFLANAQIGLSIYDITAKEPLFSHNDTLLFNPASNLKLFTSAAALELLGPSYRFRTRIMCRDKIENGRLAGDLVLVGGGDPLVSGRFRSHITEVFESWADSLIARGISRIDGGIVIDNSFFTGPSLGAGWSWDDLTYWYACPLSALSFNDNCVDLKFLPGPTIGSPALIECDPNIGYITSHNMAYTLPPESSFTLDYYRIPYTNDVTFFGGIPISDTAGEIDYVSVHRPEIYAATVFGSVLTRKGVDLIGRITAIDDLEISRRADYSRPNLISLFTWESDTLGVVVKVIDTNSQNFFAEQTLLTLGAEKAGEGSFKAGLRIITAFLDSIGIGPNDLSMYDGSGLSYINAVKPRAVVDLLRYMSARPNFETYYQSLGNPAVDRSVRGRLDGIAGRERIRAKTGHIAGVSTLSGYMRGSKENHLIAFSIMINNYTCPRAHCEAWEDKIVASLLEVY
ncbi:MAG: D-alanyl-D-alanine carboxypeptidase/D-alanyl-D-alanine-endopeptidase [candidate division Zixibacteria bacterium RBG_16_53_22]|nr:MAG: D-alanyl-D-alanine carboxypeptidase/D-alanyl-D-alanine-endopeptidase [candidate division Zixibacteria bacterium RBG_16_53_22]